MTTMKDMIAKVATGESLSIKDARKAFDIMMTGEATPSQIGGFLMALRVRGETVDEITGAAETMRSKMLRVEAPDDAMDVVGTGGDGSGTYNISTATAFVVAATGVPVAKHGNRALSSKSGAADVLAALGINIELGPDKIAEAIREAGLGFMFAPMHHAAMKHVGPTRVELGTRTIFNLLGPLSNPASVKRALVGVFSRDWVEPVAHVLKQLGMERAWVVHGSDGLDEITTTGPTYVASLEDGKVTAFEIDPQAVDISLADPAYLKGAGAEHNATALRGVLNGDRGPYRDIVLMNAGAALLIAGKAKDLQAGVNLAAEAIDCGAALERLAKLVEVTNG
ncbi:MAG: anthranilate phosphoribosyltransferase [Tepidamorphaceae bacterium]